MDRPRKEWRVQPVRPPKRAPQPNAAPHKNPPDAAAPAATRLPGLGAALAGQQPPFLRATGPRGAAGRSEAPPQPKAARAQYDLALSLAARGNDPAAIAALRQAVASDPALAAAWRKLGDLLTRAGDTKAADAAYMSYLGSAANDADLVRAAHALLDDKYDLAERLLRARLRTAPTDIAALRLLAETCVALGRAPDAEGLLQQALTLAPSFAAARHTYAVVLFRLDKAGLAIPHIERLLANDPHNAGYRTLLASCLATIGAIDRAIDTYESVIRQSPAEPALWLSYARALRHAGRRAESAQAYRKCLDRAPGTAEAYLGLVGTTKGPMPEADIAAMHSQLAKPDVSAADRAYLHYALGQAMEQAGHYAESFAHYTRGARARRAEITYDPDAASAEIQRTIELFTPDFLAARANFGSTDASPIFILGMPRAGSTLIEQILASHSMIEGTRELPEIIHIATDLANRGDAANGAAYPGCMATLEATEMAALSSRYLARSRLYRKTEKPFFIDKMPANWAHAGLIHLMFPRARIVDARRHPMASCFSAFRQCFAGGQNFSYDLTELGRYYNDYARLMRHFDQVLPGRIHRVLYEDMVADTEAEIRRLLTHCGLPFEQSCLRFWENNRPVSTASAEQVRQPIFRQGLDHWRHYERWLMPLKVVLEDGSTKEVLLS